MATKLRDPRLVQLERDLSAIGQTRLARQTDIARALGIDQETVSKAKTGRLKRWTHATEALQNYADMLLNKLSIPEPVQHKARAFLAAGGREEDLCAIIETATALVTRHRQQAVEKVPVHD